MMLARPLTVTRGGWRLGRAFHAASQLRVGTGDKIPDIDLVENSPGNKVSLATELKGKGVIVGVPAAFSEQWASSRTPSVVI